MEYTLARNAAEDLTKGLGRRGFMRAVAALGAGVGVAGVASGCAHSNASPAGSSSSALPFADGIPILQPGSGNVSGDHYLSSDPSDVMWGYVPSIHTREVMRMKSGQTRSEEHTSELQSLMRISYAVFCLKKKNNTYKL